MRQNRKLRKTVAADLRTIYTAATVEEAETRLAEFDAKWGACPCAPNFDHLCAFKIDQVEMPIPVGIGCG